MHARTLAARFPVGRIVWVQVFGHWARARVIALTGQGWASGLTVDVQVETAGAPLIVHVHHSAAATTLRVSEPFPA